MIALVVILEHKSTSKLSGELIHLLRAILPLSHSLGLVWNLGIWISKEVPKMTLCEALI